MSARVATPRPDAHADRGAMRERTDAGGSRPVPGDEATSADSGAVPDAGPRSTVSPGAPSAAPPSHPRRPDRLIGVVDGTEPGPTTILLACVHGNEPMGLRAVERILDELRDLVARGGTLRGRVAALVGNRAALAAGRRQVHRDLNRAFTYELVAPPAGDARRGANAADPVLHALDLGPAETDHERVEREELLAAIDDLLVAHADGFESYLIDLHTFSGEGPPFAVFSDTLRNRRFCRALPLPSILGLTEEVPGTLVQYTAAAGMISAVFETGRHEDPLSATLHEAVVRLGLRTAGHVDDRALGDPEADERALAEASAGVPDVLDVQHRHPVEHGDGFVMRPGWRNFAEVRLDEPLADDRTGPISAPRSGRILLPLYQSEGTDGFFVARPVHPAWLGVSAVLRRLRVSGLLAWLPGVRRVPERPNTLEVDTRVARLLAVDLFHLFGWRRLRTHGRGILFARRPWDLERPARVRLTGPTRPMSDA